MRKYIFILISLLFVLLSACGTGDSSSRDPIDNSDSNTESSNVSSKSKGTVSAEDFDKVYSDPKKFKNYEIEFTGRVFVEPEKDSDGVYLQVWADPENTEKNTLIGVNDPNFEVKTDDYISVKGIIQDQFEGENAFGGTVVAPVVMANEIEVIDYVTAVAPAIKTIEVDEEIDQHGFAVGIDKIEIAENQTRVYLKVINNSDDEVSFYSFNAKLVIDNKQLEEEYVYESDLPELQSELLPGVETEGVIIYPAIDFDISSIKFHAEGYSDNYDIDIKPFVFEINVE